MCPTCKGYVLTSANAKVYKNLDLDGDYLVGNWFYTSKTSSSSTTYNELYITVVKNSTAYPEQYTLTAYLRKYNEGVLTAVDGTAKDFKVNDITGVGSAASPSTMTMTGAVDSESLTLTAFASSDSTNAGKVKVTLGSTISGVVLNKQDHTEHVWAVMTDSDANRAAYYRYEDNHYLECSVDGCGLEFVKEDHGVGCKDCGWTSDLVPVIFCKANESELFTLYAPKTFSVTLGSDYKVKDAFGTEYTLTGGYCYEAPLDDGSNNWSDETKITGSSGVCKVSECC